MNRRFLPPGLIMSVLIYMVFSLGYGRAQDGRFPPETEMSVRESLALQLAGEGFDPAYVRSLLGDKRWELSLLVLEKNLVYRESKANYDHFLDSYSTHLAGEFLRENRAFLERTERQYGVEKEIIVAILLIESSLGRHADKHRVFNSLSSLSQAAYPDVFEPAYNHLKASYPDVTEAELRQRARRKSQWAFKELKAFLEICIREGLDVLEMRGSWAGAFGLPQFVPTSYLQYAVDGDGDHRVHLHNRYDAIASVANYLRAHGWKPGLTKDEMMRILYRYNRSGLYGETVLESAEKLRNLEVSSKDPRPKTRQGGG